LLFCHLLPFFSLLWYDHYRLYMYICEKMMSKWLFWDPDRVAFTLPVLNRPIVWYGILFAMGFFIGFYIFQYFFKRFLLYYPQFVTGKNLKERTKIFSERLMIYMIISTIIGARLGHIFFYENWSYYCCHPLEIIKIWEGGLASHGAVIGIFIGIIPFYYRSRKEFPMITIPRIFDFIIIPALLIGVFIRIGNFINQEVLGIVTTVPWAVVFGHPIDGTMPLPRHPAQLYEAFFYLCAFFLFWHVFPKMIRYPGRLSGLFFTLIFTFRFCIEFIKEEQSVFFSHQFLTMGQLLSLPMICLGIGLCSIHFFKRHQRN